MEVDKILVRGDYDADNNKHDIAILKLKGELSYSVRPSRCVDPCYGPAGLVGSGDCFKKKRPEKFFQSQNWIMFQKG